MKGLTPCPDVTLIWDANYRRVTSMADGTGTTAYTYHPFGALGGGRLASVDGPLSGDTVTYSYDELGRRVEETIAGAARSLVFDAGSRLTRETNALGVFDYSYVGATSRVASLTAPNGLLSSFSYFPNSQDRRLQTITHTGPGSLAVSSFGYGYDPAGSTATWTQNQPANPANATSHWTIEHDAADQLTGITVEAQPGERAAFSYDPAGNRLTVQRGDSVTTTAFNRLNQITGVTGGGKLRFSGATSEPANVTVQGKAAWMLASTSFTADATVNVGTNAIPVVATDGSGNSRTNNYQVVVPAAAARTFVYDPNGNLLSDGERTCAWDAKNRLIKATKGADTYEWTYNGLDQRMSEKKNGILTKRWLWTTGNQPAEERDASGSVSRRFFPQGEEIGDEKYYYTHDHLGSIREVLDAGGNVVSSYRYDAWGKRTSQGTFDYATFGFTGHLEHPALGLVFTLYRAYDPATGRWLSRDPIGETGGINLYGYVANNPVNLWDSVGFSPYPILPPYTGSHANSIVPTSRRSAPLPGQMNTAIAMAAIAAAPSAIAAAVISAPAVGSAAVTVQATAVASAESTIPFAIAASEFAMGYGLPSPPKPNPSSIFGASLSNFAAASDWYMNFVSDLDNCFD